jgi:hypothetical protein
MQMDLFDGRIRNASYRCGVGCEYEHDEDGEDDAGVNVPTGAIGAANHPGAINGSRTRRRGECVLRSITSATIPRK